MDRSEILNENNIIEKSRNLLFFKDDIFDLVELKILDIYLSRINARDINSRTVSFSKKELEELIDIKDRMKPNILDRHLNNLMKTIEIKKEEHFTKINLFEICRSYLESGKWMIELSCSPIAREYFFNLEGIGYLKYRLKNIIHIKSRYSVFLFLYLLDNSFRKEWDASISELKEVLRCNGELYEDYKYFNQRVFSKTVKEVNEKTDINVMTTPIRVNRKVEAIHFIVTTVTPSTIEPILVDNKDYSEFLAIIKETFQLKDISADRIAKKAVKQGLTKEDFTKRIKYAKQKDGIQNIVGYIMSLLENKEWDTPKANNQFNNYHQITYSERFFELIAKQDSCGLTEDEEKEMLSLC